MQLGMIGFGLSPDVFIALTAQAKVPGEAMIGEDVRLVERRCRADEMEPYERLLGDAIRVFVKFGLWRSH